MVTPTQPWWIHNAEDIIAGISVFAPGPIHSNRTLANSLPGTFVPCNFYSWELMLHGPFAPSNFHSWQQFLAANIPSIYLSHFTQLAKMRLSNHHCGINGQRDPQSLLRGRSHGDWRHHVHWSAMLVIHMRVDCRPTPPLPAVLHHLHQVASSSLHTVFLPDVYPQVLTPTHTEKLSLQKWKAQLSINVYDGDRLLTNKCV